MKKRIFVVRLLAVAGILSGILGAGKDYSLVQAAAGEGQEAEASVVDAERADEIAELSQIMTAVEDVDMKAAPEEGAAVVRSYEKGDSVFVTGRTEDGWYRVIYQDLEGYMPESVLSEKELDVEGWMRRCPGRNRKPMKRTVQNIFKNNCHTPQNTV